ncbi:MAG: alpha/beta hydrolase [Clostridiaceae bacterium]|nr:alpha/beta hydrolase [Clostridiaceae bacterium]
MRKDDILPELRQMYMSSPVIDLENGLNAARNLPKPVFELSPLVKTTVDRFKGPESDLLVKIYERKDRGDEFLPGVFWIHGGGYVLGHPDVDDGICEKFVLDANCVVVSVDYRLAPEHPYPAAIEDCYAGLKWMVDNAEALKIDASRIGIAGASAGGGLTAALALLARDRGGPKIKFQMPLYPMIDDRNITFSSHEITAESYKRVWNRELNMVAWKMYLGEMDSDEVPQYAAPARAKDLSGLPPAYTCVGQLDPFRDETIDYVARLAQAGVPVEFHLYPGCFHGFDAYSCDAKISRQARDEYVNAMAKALHS